MQFEVVAALPKGGRGGNSPYAENLNKFAALPVGTIAQVTPGEGEGNAVKLGGKLRRAAKGLNLNIKVKLIAGGIWLVRTAPAAPAAPATPATPATPSAAPPATPPAADKK